MKQTLIKRGDIFWVDFDPAKDTEIQKTRPAIVCSHDILNQNSSRIIVAPITSNLKRVYSFEFELHGPGDLRGKVMIDQLRTVDKSRLGKKIGTLSILDMREIDAVIKLVLGVK